LLDKVYIIIKKVKIEKLFSC